MAANDWTTLANLKQYLSTPTSNTADDDLFSRMITAASAFLVKYLQRDILQKSYVEQRNGNGTNRLMLRRYPVTAVSNLTIYGRDIPPSQQPGVMPGFWFDDKVVYVKGYYMPVGFGNVMVGYTAGFEEIPADLEQVCIELVANKYKRRDRLGQDSKSIGGEVVSFSKLDLSKDHADLLGYWRNVVPVE